MFATTTSAVPIAVCVSDVAKTVPQRRRRISPERGRALEKLGHAIEYLTDEFVRESGSSTGSNGLLTSVQLLVDLRRQVYMEAPEIQPFNERLRLFWAELLS